MLNRSGPGSDAGVPLLATGTVVLVTLALTEGFDQLPAAIAAYAGAWWALGLRRHGGSDQEGRP